MALGSSRGLVTFSIKVSGLASVTERPGRLFHSFIIARRNELKNDTGEVEPGRNQRRVAHSRKGATG